MIFDQLDELDKKVVTSLVEGVSDEDIMSTFGVDAGKIMQLRPVAAEFQTTGAQSSVASSPTEPEKEGDEESEAAVEDVSENAGEEGGEGDAAQEVGSTSESSAGDGSTE